jgi:hypothetical protein
MTGPAPRPCPSCGTLTNAAFCSQCGAAVGSRRCGSCGTAISDGARFCGQCGTAAGGAARAGSSSNRATTLAYLGTGIAVLAVVLALVWSNATPTDSPVSTGTGDPTAIDLASMTPRERFDRLYDRVMRAAESGDQSTVDQFSPMALSAYTQLDAFDADARYHAAMIRMHTGDPAGAAALADTIRTEASSHLFSYVIHATLARQRGDSARMLSERTEFLRHYDAELAALRPEYQQHQFILDQMQADARLP